MSDEYILIVDDDSDIRNLLGIYLENEGVQLYQMRQRFEGTRCAGKIKSRADTS